MAAISSQGGSPRFLVSLSEKEPLLPAFAGKALQHLCTRRGFDQSRHISKASWMGRGLVTSQPYFWGLVAEQTTSNHINPADAIGFPFEK
jgi:hypothetical protein